MGNVTHRRILSVTIAAAAAGVVAALMGCSLEAPETPRFETTFYLPIQEETYTGQQMAQGLQAIAADTSAPGPLTIQIEEAIAPLALGGRIAVEVAARVDEADLERIDFRAPVLPTIDWTLSWLLSGAPPAAGLPVPAFEFAQQSELSAGDHFTEVEFAAGWLRLIVRNSLPVPVGGDGERTLRVALVAAADSRLVTEWLIAEEIAPGAQAELAADLQGLCLPSALRLLVSGGSPGTNGELLESGEGELALDFVFESIAATRLIGPLPALDVATETPLTFADGCSVTRAEVSAGRLEWRFDSHLPVPVAVRLSAPQLVLDGTPLQAETEVAPGVQTILSLDLAGALLEREGGSDLVVEITAWSDSSGQTGEISLGPGVTAALGATEIQFAAVRGVLNRVEVALDPVESEVDYPVGVDGVEIVAAEAEIVVRNRAAVAAEARLELWAAVGPDTVRVPIVAAIGAGSAEAPAETRVLLDESDSEIAALLQLRPACVRLGGVVAIGDGTTEGEVLAGDYVDGSFSLRAPMRMVLETAHQEGDPFEVELDEELRERVSENLLELTVATQVENHFPTAVQVKLHFARDRNALFVADDLVLEAAPIAAAEVDPATGRVSASTLSALEMTVADGQLALFTAALLYGGLEVTLLGDGVQPIEIWSTDFVKVKGVAAFRYKVR